MGILAFKPTFGGTTALRQKHYVIEDRLYDDAMVNSFGLPRLPYVSLKLSEEVCRSPWYMLYRP